MCDVDYIFSLNLITESCKNPAVKNRARLVHNLIKSYGLLEYVNIVESKRATYQDLRHFHSDNYLQQLTKFQHRVQKKINRSDLLKHIPESPPSTAILSSSAESSDETISEELEEFGLGFDCRTWPTLYQYCLEVAGSTITACERILNGSKLVINWFGGWHHAQRDKAAGFCYINDIVLGILNLKRKFDRILYLDLDVHHGDGVQYAFETSKRVLTLSFHQYESGFYPGTGTTKDIGLSNGKGYTINCPYKSGISGKLLQNYFFKIINKVFSVYEPKMLIVQCGGDVICGDPLGSSNLIPNDFIPIIKWILQQKSIPKLFLGGGGYNFSNTSRYWTLLTSLICNKEIENDVPYDNEDYLKYSPTYELNIDVKNIKDNNNWEDIEKFCNQIEENLQAFSVLAV